MVWLAHKVLFSIAKVPHNDLKKEAMAFYFCYLTYVKKDNLDSYISAQTLSCLRTWRWRLNATGRAVKSLSGFTSAAVYIWAIFTLSHQICSGVNHEGFSWTAWDALGQQRTWHPWAGGAEEKQKAAQSRATPLAASAHDAEWSSSLVSLN